MSKKSKLKSPWDNIQSAIWLIGMAILFMTGDWWPGILILIAVSALAEFVIERLAPDAVEIEPEAAAAPKPAAAELSAAPAEPAPVVRRTDLLPASCPSCGAKVRIHEVRWSDEQFAECAYCGSPLPRNAQK